MRAPVRYFYDVPVYRLEEERYADDLNHHIESTLFPISDPLSSALRERDWLNPSEKASLRDHLTEKYGGCWLYNEIVGYIRLFFLGSQVRGEYFAISQRRAIRTRHKIFILKSLKLAPEREIPNTTANLSIFETVLQYINDCRKELPRRRIDSRLLEAVGPHVDWQALLSE